MKMDRHPKTERLQPDRTAPGGNSGFLSGADRGVRLNLTVAMSSSTEKRIARARTNLTRRTVDALKPAEKPGIARDARLTGFGVRIHPSGTRC